MCAALGVPPIVKALLISASWASEHRCIVPTADSCLVRSQRFPILCVFYEHANCRALLHLEIAKGDMADDLFTKVPLPELACQSIRTVLHSPACRHTQASSLYGAQSSDDVLCSIAMVLMACKLQACAYAPSLKPLLNLPGSESQPLLQGESTM